MIAVAPMAELVEVESYALALARQLMAWAFAAAVFPDALCLARLGTLRADYGAHTGFPSAGRLIPCHPRFTLDDDGWSGS
jgi:hypothetical protein